MHVRRSLFPLLAAGVVAWLVLAACSAGKLGYGVVLWSANNSPLTTGQIVTVKTESQINNTYAVQMTGSKNALDVPIWRIKLFTKEQEAINYSLAYSPMVPMFAKASTNGVIIRQQPNAAATQVYRMREGQVIKVIAREPDKVMVDGVEGYWYQVLTSDGVLGYSFNANLDIYNPSVANQQQQSAGQQLLDKVLGTTYRPEYFQQMINSNQVDLKRFSPKYGFFADPQAKTIQIVMPTYDLNFTYTGITKRAPGDYTFNGTPVELIIISPDQIQLLYTDTKGNQYDKVFVNIKQNIAYIVEKEMNRRLQIYNTFLGSSPYSSTYYGKISLKPNMQFSWTGYSRLVPDIIPSGAGPTGTVGFPLFLSSSLQGSYDGAITFNFGATAQTSGGSATIGGSQSGSGVAQSGSGSGVDLAAVPSVSPGSGQSAGTSTVSFLYNVTSSGVKLTYIPQSTINGDIVTNVSSTPIVIVFSSNPSGG